MNKKFLAIAIASAFAGPAMAQGVTLGGNISTSVLNIDDGTQKRTAVDNNTGSTSMMIIRGEEDLGGGLKAFFNFEGALGADNGTLGTSRVTRGSSTLSTSTTTTSTGGSGTVTASTSTTTTDPTYSATNTLFSRQANVGLEGGFGRVMLGRMQTAVNAWKDVNAGIKLFDNAQTAAVGRPANSIGYFSPVVNGLQLQVQHSRGVLETEGTTTADKDFNQASVFGAEYVSGPLTLRAAMGSAKKIALDATNAILTAATLEDKDSFVSIGYTLNNIRFEVANHTYKTKTLSTSATTKTSVNMATAVVPLGTGLNLRLAFHDQDIKDSANDARMYGLGLTKNLSKRTWLFAVYRSGDNKGTSSEYGALSGGTDTKVYGVGINHSF